MALSLSSSTPRASPRIYPHSLPANHVYGPSLTLALGHTASPSPIRPHHTRSSSLTPSRAPTPTPSITPAPVAPAPPSRRPMIMTSDDLAICHDFSSPQDVLIVCNAVDSETSHDVGFFVNSAVLRASYAWFAACIDDRPPDYEPGAVIRIAVDVPSPDMEVLIRMMYAGSSTLTSIRVTLGQVLHTIPPLMVRYKADRTLWALLTSYLPPWRLYGLERGANGHVLRENIWAVLVLAHAARDAKVWANTLGIVAGNRPPEAEWALLWDPFSVRRSEITPEREVIYRILLAVARMRARVGGLVEFEYTPTHFVVSARKHPEFKLFFALEDPEPLDVFL